MATFIRRGNGLGSGPDNRIEILTRLRSKFVGKRARRYETYSSDKPTYADDVVVLEVVPHSVRECASLRWRGQLKEESDYFRAVLRTPSGHNGMTKRLTLLEVI